MFIFKDILDAQGFEDILMKLADMTLLLGEILDFTETQLAACLTAYIKAIH